MWGTDALGRRARLWRRFGGRQDDAIRRRAGRTFSIKGKVDGTPVVFVADTGATTVLLSYEDARKAGIDMGEGLQFTSPVLTANGQAMAAPYRISEITLGDIRRANVIAMISQPDMVGTSLLGMSFLGRLSSFEVRGNQLTLHD